MPPSLLLDSIAAAKEGFAGAKSVRTAKSSFLHHGRGWIAVNQRKTPVFEKQGWVGGSGSDEIRTKHQKLRSIDRRLAYLLE